MGAFRYTAATGLTAALAVALAVTFAADAPAAEGPALPPAEYKPLPVGTKVEYDKWAYRVEKSDGFGATIRTTKGNWFQTYAAFGREGGGRYTLRSMSGTRGRGSVFAWDTDFSAKNRRNLESLWPLRVGKKTDLEFQETANRRDDINTRNWHLAVEVVATELLQLDGFQYPTYVVRAHASSSALPGVWMNLPEAEYSETFWYHPDSGLVLKFARKWIRGDVEPPEDPSALADEYRLTGVTFPAGATANVLKGTPLKPVVAAGAAPAPAASPLAPAPFTPLPVGTKVEYDNRTDIVAKSDGFAAVIKRQVGADASWVLTHALFGEYASNLFVRATRGEPVEYELDDKNKKKLEMLWPLAVGKAATYQLYERAGWEGVSQTWTVALSVSKTETVDVARNLYRTYVIEERAESDGGMAFSGRQWYHPETGLIVRATRTWTKAHMIGGMAGYYKVPHVAEGAEENFALRKVDFPPGKTPPAPLVAEGERAAGARAARTDKTPVAAGPGKVAEESRAAEDAKARAAEIAELKREAEAALNARAAEIAKLKQEADQALKAREAEIARLREALANRQQEGAGTAAEIGGVEFGRYHALVIGIDNYKELPRLKTAVNDARAVAEVLEKDYGFSVTLLIDPDAGEIVDRLDIYRETLGPKDNLLIYYAGHGWLDKEVDRGYWLPVDAKPKRRSGWVSNATVSDTLKALSAKHVMVVADSCYSGTLVRGAEVGTRTRTGDYWKRMAEKWARVAITSGGLEPVADAGGGKHSPFAKAFIDGLRANASVMDGTQLFTQMRRPVMVAAQQTPQYADVREAGHDGGDFLFVRKKK